MSAPFEPSATHPHYNACIPSTKHGGRFVQMEAACSGYLRVVRNTLEHILETRRDLDVMIYPVLATWRHYLELRLKLMCLSLADLGDERPEVYVTHNLRWLWSKARGGLMSSFPSESEDTLLVVDAHIDALSELDPDSMRLRYTVDTKGQPSLPQTLTHIGYVELAQVIEQVSNMLEGVTCCVDNALDYLNDARAEWRAAEREAYRDH